MNDHVYDSCGHTVCNSWTLNHVIWSSRPVSSLPSPVWTYHPVILGHPAYRFEPITDVSFSTKQSKLCIKSVWFDCSDLLNASFRIKNLSIKSNWFDSIHFLCKMFALHPPFHFKFSKKPIMKSIILSSLLTYLWGKYRKYSHTFNHMNSFWEQ